MEGPYTLERKEVETMWNIPTKEQLDKIPRLYETEEIPLKEKLVYLHFFIGGCDWYVFEYDGEDLFWGYAILNGDLEMAEFGYISFEELKSIKIPPGFEIDCEVGWEVKKAIQVEKIRMGNGWSETEEPGEDSSRKEKKDDTRTDLAIGRDH
jgi:hypothetical protein